MSTARTGLAVLLVCTYVLACYTVRPVQHAVAPRRLAAVRAAVLVGAFGVAATEVLSALRRLSVAGVVTVWVLALLVAAVAAVGRRRWDLRHRAPGADPAPPDDPDLSTGADGGRPPPNRRRPLDRLEWLLVGVLVLLVGAELVLAVASPPNTYDSQTYHLPRIETWVQQGSVALFPTAIHRQITYPPGAEFLLVHLRLLTGSDVLYNLLQWSAGLLALAVVTRIVAQFGGSRRGQLLAALVAGSVPMVVLQSSSTQTDLTVAAWVGCVATLALDGVGRTATRWPASVLYLGLATGLVAVTKATGALVVGPLLVWWCLAHLRRGRRAAGRPMPATLGRTAAATVGIALLAVVLAGPQLLRIYEVFGHPLGPERLRTSLTLQRHDPGTLVINALRMAHTALEIPVPPVNRWAADRIIDLAGVLGVHPSDPLSTFYAQVFPDESWYPHEDKAALPLHAALLVIGAAAALRAARGGGDRRPAAYALVLAIAAVGYATIFKWQPWGNRLLLFLVIPAAPLAGLWIDRVLADGRRLARGAVAGALMVAACAGLLTTAYGYPRRLLGDDSALVRDDLTARFAIRPEWTASYLRAADAVKASGARRVGTIAMQDNWEYPWWLLLEGRELRSLQSPVPARLPPVRADEIDAAVCAAPAWFCWQYLPAGWPLQHDGTVGWAFPPPRP